MIENHGAMKNRSAKFLKWNYGIINDLEKRYPDAFDKAVETMPEILNFAPNHTPRAAIFEKLNHATDHVRIEALKHIAKNTDILQVEYFHYTDIKLCSMNHEETHYDAML